MLQGLGSVAAGALLCAALVACGGGGGGGGGVADPFSVEPGTSACGAGCDEDRGGSEGGGDGGVSGGEGGDAGVGAGLSMLRHARARFTEPDGTLLGEAVLEDGVVSIHTGDYDGPFIVTVSDDGTGQGEYFDEGRKDWVALGDLELHAMVPSVTHHIGVTALTEAAYQLALERHGDAASLTARRMTAANEVVRKAFNATLGSDYDITDITNFATLINDASTPQTLPDTHAGRYGAVLAALAVAAERFDDTLEAPAVAFARELAADLVDNELIDASPADRPAYTVDVASEVNAALGQVREDFGADTPVANVTYDATSAFQLERNPSSVWAYLVTSDGITEPLDTTTPPSGVIDDLQPPGDVWWWSQSNESAPTYLWRNTSSGTFAGVAPGQLSIGPGFAVVTLRFAAPADGSYEVTGQFFAGDGLNGIQEVRINGQTVQRFGDSSVDHPFALDNPIPLAAGDTIDFVIDNSDSSGAGNTPISVQVEALP